MSSGSAGEAAAVGVVALGANLPGRFASVQEGLEAAVAALPGVGFEVLGRSGWWRSAAWPDASAPAFLNGVALVRAQGEPLGALRRLKGLEAEFGRRDGPRNAARPLDLDLIAWGDAVMQTPELTLPHPRARERLFVMGPLAEVAAGWRWPGGGETARELSERAMVGADATPVA